MAGATVDRLPWEKQPKESATAFAAFALYRDLGPERSLVKAGEHLGKTAGTLSSWSKKHHWVERVDQYDHYLDKRRIEQMQESWRVANIAHRHITTRLREAVQAKLEGDPARGITPLDPDDLEWSDVARLAREAITLERLSHGQPTDLAARVVSIDVNTAVDHIKTLVELARRHMDAEQFQAFILDYKAATAVMIESPREPRAIGGPR